MTTIAVCSAKGSPGVTTLACALGAVWPTERQILLVECDPSGGDLAARFGLSAKRGTSSLMLEARRLGAADLKISDHLQTLPGGLEVLAGPSGAGAARTVDAGWSDCLRYLTHHDQWSTNGSRDLVLDCGRIQPGARGQRAVLGFAEHVLVVSRPTIESLTSTRWIAEQLNRAEDAWSANGAEPYSNHWASPLIDAPAAAPSSFDDPIAGRKSSTGLVLVGQGPVAGSQAALALGLRLLATIPDDVVGAAALRGEAVNSRRLSRSALVAAVRSLALILVGSQCEEAPHEPYQLVAGIEPHIKQHNAEGPSTDRESSPEGDSSTFPGGTAEQRMSSRRLRHKRLTRNAGVSESKSRQSGAPVIGEMTS
jgi:hypothetical protein